MAQLLMQRVTWRTASPAVCANAAVFGAIGTCTWFALGSTPAFTFQDPGVLVRIALVGLVAQFCLYLDDLYDPRMAADPREFASRMVRAMGTACLLVVPLYLLFPELMLAQGVLVAGIGLAMALLAAGAVGFSWLSGRMPPRERLLLVGTKPAALELARELGERRVGLGVEVVGFVEPEKEPIRSFVPKPGIVGRVGDIPELVKTRGVDRVVVSLSDARGKLPIDQMLQMKLAGVRFDHLASVYEEYTGKIAVENLRPSWLIFSDGFRKPRLAVLAKRVTDLVVSTLGLLAAAPLMGVLALIVQRTSQGPALYHQRRTGKDGRPFTLHKFRTMRADAEAATGAVWASEEDPRITPVGRFLRRTRLDELPQLWNVLRGEMSLVGPRPERPEFVERLTEDIPFYGERHVVNPGLTGWAQVRYTYGSSVEDAMEKLQYDLFYVKNMSLALDAYILFSTLKIMLLRRGSR